MRFRFREIDILKEMDTVGAPRQLQRRHQLAAIARAGIAAVTPERCLGQAFDDSDRFWPEAARDGYLLVAIGKASVAMAEATIGRLGPPMAGVVATHHMATTPLPNCDIVVADHPVPDHHTLLAGASAAAMVHDAPPATPVVVLISGGASSLIDIPRSGVDLGDLRAVNELLLRSGLAISSMNVIRQALSKFKGGGLARLVADRPSRTLVISDVVGNDPAIIASGPMSAPLWRTGDPWEICPNSVRSALPQHLRELLRSATPLAVPDHPITVVADASRAALAARSEAERIGFNSHLLTTTIEGDATERARWMLRQAGPGLSICTGETTVVVSGDGVGGRNQHAALTWAVDIDDPNSPVAAIAIGTDGRDGPTEAAGGLVDGATATRIRSRGGDPLVLLERQDSHRALELSGDLIPAEPTGTNVGDIWMIAR